MYIDYWVRLMKYILCNVMRGAQMMAYLFVLRVHKVLSTTSSPCRLVKIPSFHLCKIHRCITYTIQKRSCARSCLHFIAAYIDTEIQHFFFFRWFKSLFTYCSKLNLKFVRQTYVRFVRQANLQAK
jgi:hypothetical protein